MVRYYFDFRDGDGVARDETGQDLDSIEAVRKSAVTAAGEALRDVTLSGQEAHVAIEVRDGSGPVMTVEGTVVIKRAG
jgi:hypothetical protein